VTPFYKIEISGQDITSLIGPAVSEVQLYDRSGQQSDSLEIELSDAVEISWPSFGAEMAIELGYKEDEQSRRNDKFKVAQVSHKGVPERMRVSGTPLDMGGPARQPRERTFRRMTIGDLIATLAAEHGYEAKVVPEELARIELLHVDQSGLSDVNLAYNVARNHDAVFKVVDGIWWVRSYDELGEPQAYIRKKDVLSWSFLGQSRKTYNSVRAHYHDFDKAARVPVIAGEGDPELTLDETFPDADVAKWRAKSALGRAKRSERSITLRTKGMPHISSQMVIKTEGFRDELNSVWLVTEVTHTINSGGYMCSIRAEGL
jgi:hypothetical protein